MFNLVIILSLIVAALLIVVILLQSSKGTGLAGSAFGSGASSALGVRRTADFLSKTTSVLAVTLGLLCILSNYLIPRAGSESNGSFIDNAQKNAPVTAPATPGETPAK